MSKLEQKLIELGYKTVNKENCKLYFKLFKCWVKINIYINLNENRVYYHNCEPFFPIENKKDLKVILKTIKQAFNEMQKDLAILKECEE